MVIHEQSIMWKEAQFKNFMKNTMSITLTILMLQNLMSKQITWPMFGPVGVGTIVGLSQMAKSVERVSKNDSEQKLMDHKTLESDNVHLQTKLGNPSSVLQVNQVVMFQHQGSPDQ